MISFKQYLQEARMAPLYHGTKDALRALEIIKSNTLNTGYSDNDPNHKTISPKTGKIISLTRNKRFAMQWASYSSSRTPVVFQINQQKLVQRYKLRPFSYFGSIDIPHDKTKKFGGDPDLLFQNQYEEAVIGKDITNFLSYVDAILIPDKSSMSFIGALTTKETDALEKLIEHPKTIRVKWEHY